MATEFGKYTIQERLGGGGMAEVFGAVLTGPGGFEKRLAIKLILPQFSDDEEFVSMFIHEATLAAVLDHANIVRIHEFDQINGRYYIAMELVDGKDLRAVLARVRKIGRPLKIGEAVLLSMEISRGLSFAHGELTPGAPTVIHRDISPHNVILSRAGEVKITDFGIAKLSSSASFTKTGVVKGKLAYMSPEQASGMQLDERSDLFSLGCVMWELLTGQRLFRSKNDMEALSKLKEAPILPPSTHNPEVPAQLDQLVLSCLVRQRDKRVSSASEICNDLDAVLLMLAMDDRSSALASLFRELFGTVKGRKGTAVMAAANLALNNSFSDEDEKQGIEGKVNPQPNDSVGSPGLVEPAGPEAKTLLDEYLFQGKVKSRQKVRKNKEKFYSYLTVKKSLFIGLMVGFLLVLSIAFFLDPSEINTEINNGTNSGLGEDGELAGYGLKLDRGINLGFGDLAKGQANHSIHEMPQNTEDGGISEAAHGAGEGGTAGNNDGDHLSSDDGSLSSNEPEGRRGKQKTASKVSKKKPVGFLNLNAIPWAKVYMGRRFLGVTPLERLPLAHGKHRLTLLNDELGIRRSVMVVIRAGLATKKLVDLR